MAMGSQLSYRAQERMCIRIERVKRSARISVLRIIVPAPWAARIGWGEARRKEQLSRRFRTIEIVSVGEEGSSTLAWGRGEEVGETLEEEEAQYFGKRVSLLRADPTAPKRTHKGQRPAPRLLRAFSGVRHAQSPIRLPRAPPVM